MQRRLGGLAAIILGLAFAAPASAKPAERSPVALAFGNTIKATYPDGRFQRYWLQADGTWRAIGRRGKPSSGKWTARGERLCLRQTRPVSSPIRYCTTFPADAEIGREWPAKDLGGKPIRLVVVKGAS